MIILNIRYKIVFCCLILFWQGAGFGSPALEAIKQIPLEDREYLSSFFRGLLSQGSFATTLFGQKSAASFDYPNEFVLKLEDPVLRTRFITEIKGWRIWKKYQHLFEIKNYSFIELSYGYKSFLFVNIPKMASVLSSHHDFFVEYFSKNTPLKNIDIYTNYKKTSEVSNSLSTFLTNAFKPNFHANDFHIMQGLLLGYSFENCFDFQERCRIEDTLTYFPYDVDLTECSQAPESLLDGYPKDLIERRLRFEESFSMKRKWPDSNPFFCTSSPGNMAFDNLYDPAADALKQKIATLYNSDHFFEDFITVLSR